ncbi:hypothetical protein BC936DRAFT_140800, partial [Jimgerdemannia flammicorona]
MGWKPIRVVEVREGVKGMSRLKTNERGVPPGAIVREYSTSTLLITGSADNSVKLWEVRTGRCLKTWEFKTAVKRVEFTEEGDMALCVSEQRMGFPGAVTILEINPDIDAER